MGNPQGVSLDVAVNRYNDLSQSAEKFIVGAPLDMVPLRQPVWTFARHWSKSLHTVVLHLIDETARHAGHMDIICELLLAERQ